jgi:putative oxygen-independent coproporphyrinogen III oxidase
LLVVNASHLYIHVPFCVRRCSYCDFAIAVRRDVPAAEFITAVRREIELRFGTQRGDVLETLYLGGGTPSRLGPDAVTQLLDVVRLTWPLAPDAEVTLEANPEDVDRHAVAAWHAAGVTRVSLGVQSFDDRVLHWMHRTHDAARVESAIDALRAGGFENWSLDLIAALPASLERDWGADLARAVALGPAHVSCYGLTIEPQTPLARWRARGDVVDTDEADFEREFLQAHAVLSHASYEHYEVSNYARSGRRSRHNSAYWRRVPYIGLGPSAHGFDGATRRWNVRDYREWRARICERSDPVEGEEGIARDQAELEQLYLDLRTSNGVQICPSNRRLLEVWRDAGWCEISGDRVRLTATGWLRLDALVAALTESRSPL